MDQPIDTTMTQTAQTTKTTETLDARSTIDHGAMPDVASNDGSQLRGRLDRVGMGDIEIPIRLPGKDGTPFMVPARAEAYVNLRDPDAKGIHMSRLFISLQDMIAEELLSPALVNRCLQSFIDSHAGLSDQSQIILRYEHMLQRKALKSNNSAWRSYPCEINAVMQDGVVTFKVKISVAYSSTCPCSAALARQLIQESFRKQFAGQEQVSTQTIEAWLSTEEAICATPHSQRSYAHIEVVLGGDAETFAVEALVDAAESVLQTAVQAAVKREDEQEFARLNGQNLMFCEDAARRLRHWLDALPVADYRVKVSHVESLHPHDAVSMVVKGVAGGLSVE